MYKFVIMWLDKSLIGMWCIRMKVYHRYCDVGMVVCMIQLLISRFMCSMYMLTTPSDVILPKFEGMNAYA